MQQQIHLVRAYSLISSFNIFVQSESTTTLYTAQGINQSLSILQLSDLMGTIPRWGQFLYISFTVPELSVQNCDNSWLKVRDYDLLTVITC